MRRFDNKSTCRVCLSLSDRCLKSDICSIVEALIKSVMYDCIVVGAGVEGLSTASRLAEFGKSVLLLEQVPNAYALGKIVSCQEKR